MATKKEKPSQSEQAKKGKEEAIEAIAEVINKKYGQGSFMKLGAQTKVDIDVIPTGALTLDAALGIGGVPRGRISEVYGHEASGKTTLTLHVIAEAQRAGGNAAFIDAEHALDPKYARALGVNTDDLYISQPDSGEEALDILDKIISSNAFDVAVVDSVAALVSRAELSGEIGDAHVALQARLMSQSLRRLTSIIAHSNTAVIFINQIRQNISTTGYGAGATETTTGGKALKFYSSLRLDVRRTEWVRKGDETIGHKIKVKVVKNKLSAPFKVIELEIIFGKGISKPGLLIDMGMQAKTITRSGAWFYYNGEQVSQGKEKLRELIENDPIFSRELEIQVRNALGLKGADALQKEIEDIKSGKLTITKETPEDADEDPITGDTALETTAQES